jgi:hypothetical protein
VVAGVYTSRGMESTQARRDLLGHDDAVGRRDPPPFAAYAGRTLGDERHLFDTRLSVEIVLWHAEIGKDILNRPIDLDRSRDLWHARPLS